MVSRRDFQRVGVFNTIGSEQRFTTEEQVAAARRVSAIATPPPELQHLPPTVG